MAARPQASRQTPRGALVMALEQPRGRRTSWWCFARSGSDSLSPPPAVGERGSQRSCSFARFGWAVDLLASRGSVVAGRRTCPGNTRRAARPPQRERARRTTEWGARRWCTRQAGSRSERDHLERDHERATSMTGTSRWGHQLNRQSEIEIEEEALPLPVQALRISPRQS